MKEDQNKLSSQNEKETVEQVEEKATETKPSAWQMFIKKKWFFPALYLGAAALILAVITWYQSPDNFAIDPNDLVDVSELDESFYNDWDEITGDADEGIPVTGSQENMIWPVAMNEGVQVALNFYDDQASEEEKAASIIHHDQSYYPSQGISIKRSDDEAFDVVAALSGRVIAADKNPLVGYYVEIEHHNGLVTVYQSLENIDVEEGQELSQGDVIGKAGRSVFYQDLGIHVYFEVREEGLAVNPDKYLAMHQE